MKIGRRLAIKVLNASKFVLGQGTAPADADGHRAARPPRCSPSSATSSTGPPPRSTRTTTRGRSRPSRSSSGRSATTTSSWSRTGRTAPAATARLPPRARRLSLALSTQLRLFAPFLPFVTEEVWSWWQEGSVHRAAWPTAAELARGPEVPAGTLAAVGEVLSLVRKAKSEAKVSMRADVVTRRRDGDARGARAGRGGGRGPAGRGSDRRSRAGRLGRPAGRRGRAGARARGVTHDRHARHRRPRGG